MGYPLTLALRYLRSKKRASISVGTMFAVLGVALGVAALATVMSVTGGFQAQFREKVLGVNAHVLVLRHSEFRDYRDVMAKVAKVPGVLAVAPFSIHPMMLAHGEATATGVLVKGVDPELSLGVDAKPGTVPVLDLPRHIVLGEHGACDNTTGDMTCGIAQLRGLRRPDAKPGAGRTPLPELPPPDREPPLPPGIVPDVADAGTTSDARDDAGFPIRLKERLFDSPADASAPPPLPLPQDDVEDEGAVADAGPGASSATGAGGSVVPDGGYTSVLPDDDELPPELSDDACSDPDRVKNMPGIVIGASLAKTLKLGIGDCLLVTSPTIGYQYAGGALKPPVAKSFRVKAIFDAGFDQYDSKLVYIDVYEVQSFYDQGDTVMGVEMKIADIDRAEDVVRQVKETLASTSYVIMDWRELNRGLFTALLIQQVGMSGVLALIILVAAFTVVATLIMVVLEKKKEIAVIKAMGATDWAILRVFLYQGGMIGFFGTTLGLLIGFGVCKGLIVYAFPLDPKVYFISHLPVLIRPFEFIVTGTVAVILCLFATILPSLYAASLRPAEGFRDQ